MTKSVHKFVKALWDSFFLKKKIKKKTHTMSKISLPFKDICRVWNWYFVSNASKINSLLKSYRQHFFKKNGLMCASLTTLP